MTANTDTIRRFYDGIYYPIAVILLVFLGHVLELDVLFAALIALSVIPALLLCSDLRFLITPYLSIYFVIGVKDYTPSQTGMAERFLNPAVLTLAAILAVALIVAFVLFFKHNAKNANPLHSRALFWSMILFCCILLTNGVFFANYTPKNLLFVSSIALPLLVSYLPFALFLRFDRKTFDYFLSVLVLIGLLLSAELLFAYATTVRFENGQIVKESVILGWGVWTNVGCMLAMLMPACFYFAHSHRYGWIGLILGFFEFFCIVLSQSRGALLVGALALMLCLLILCIGGKNRRFNRVFTAVVFGLGGVAVLLVSEHLAVLVKSFLQTGFSDNGRFEIWRLGISNFKRAPIFGCGFYESYENPAWDVGVFPHLYHNTVIQLLSSGGVMALLAYLCHRVLSIRALFRSPTHGKLFLAVGILSLLAFSLLDVMFFMIYPIMFYSLMLLFMENGSFEPNSSNFESK
ncbi:MAG: O-antigen ligase family protein [Ruminococcaceae bacterium]|nr:O-antigen ligase family protein [Oscillospiraceae bacterium]